MQRGNKTGLRLTVSVSVYPFVRTLTVAFLDRFLPKLEQLKGEKEGKGREERRGAPTMTSHARSLPFFFPLTSFSPKRGENGMGRTGKGGDRMDVVTYLDTAIVSIQQALNTLLLTTTRPLQLVSAWLTHRQTQCACFTSKILPKYTRFMLRIRLKFERFTSQMLPFYVFSTPCNVPLSCRFTSLKPQSHCPDLSSRSSTICEIVINRNIFVTRSLRRRHDSGRTVDDRHRSGKATIVLNMFKTVVASNDAATIYFIFVRQS